MGAPRMNVLSLFDGISCGQQALKNLGIPVDHYYASEIDEKAIQITQKNFPETIQLGDVNNIDFTQFTGKIDLIFGGFPCQDLSICAHGKGLQGARSGLFYKLLEALRTIKPKYFLVENVASMDDANKEIISKELGVQPIFINSAEVSAQDRKRLYWTNIPFDKDNKPQDKYMHVKDLLVETDKGHVRNEFVPIAKSGVGVNRCLKIGNLKKLTDGSIIRGQAGRVFSVEGKTCTLCALGGGGGAKTGLYKVGDVIRRLSPLEAERAQSLPDNYTEGISDSARYKAIGNGWNVKTIEWLCKNL